MKRKDEAIDQKNYLTNAKCASEAPKQLSTELSDELFFQCLPWLVFVLLSEFLVAITTFWWRRIHGEMHARFSLLPTESVGSPNRTS
jgi:hypothetical protein